MTTPVRPAPAPNPASTFLVGASSEIRASPILRRKRVNRSRTGRRIWPMTAWVSRSTWLNRTTAAGEASWTKWPNCPPSLESEAPRAPKRPVSDFSAGPATRARRSSEPPRPATCGTPAGNDPGHAPAWPGRLPDGRPPDTARDRQTAPLPSLLNPPPAESGKTRDGPGRLLTPSRLNPVPPAVGSVSPIRHGRPPRAEPQECRLAQVDADRYARHGRHRPPTAGNGPGAPAGRFEGVGRPGGGSRWGIVHDRATCGASRGRSNAGSARGMHPRGVGRPPGRRHGRRSPLTRARKGRS